MKHIGFLVGRIGLILLWIAALTRAVVAVDPAHDFSGGLAAAFGILLVSPDMLAKPMLYSVLLIFGAMSLALLIALPCAMALRHWGGGSLVPVVYAISLIGRGVPVIVIAVFLLIAVDPAVDLSAGRIPAFAPDAALYAFPAMALVLLPGLLAIALQEGEGRSLLEHAVRADILRLFPGLLVVEVLSGWPGLGALAGRLVAAEWNHTTLVLIVLSAIAMLLASLVEATARAIKSNG
ncbi:hypothetical protein KHP62_05550 [Rhodobacteraceae bacterium NNCM2]|nr:hypothetical protein [Coraliihabitans acroporae]